MKHRKTYYTLEGSVGQVWRKYKLTNPFLFSGRFCSCGIPLNRGWTNLCQNGLGKAIPVLGSGKQELPS